ncbi:MAG: type II secretion system minor pseudopilin GspK [Mariprofundaceae bacterium]
MASLWNKRQGRSERGVALVIVLGLVALISAWAATSAREDWISLRRAENMDNAMRVWLATESGIALVRMMLKDDAENSDIDSLEEIWATPTPPYPVDNGTVAGEFFDANRFLNLNNLVNAQGVVQPAFVEVMKRLFMQLELSPLLVDAIVDWLDRDNIPFGSGGAEEMAYMDQRYAVKNALFDGVRELRLVVGFDEDIVNKIRPFVIARANMANMAITPVNINTASREVLMAMANLSVIDAENILSLRNESAFERVADLTGKPEFAGLAAFATRLVVISDAFFARIHAQFGRANWREEILLARNGQNVSIVYRRKLGWKE